MGVWDVGGVVCVCVIISTPCTCRHKCPCCNTVLNATDLIKDVGFDALISTYPTILNVLR